MITHRFGRIAALFLGLVLVTAACERDGDDDGGETAAGPTETTGTTGTTGATAATGENGAPAGEGTLQTITDRGVLRCGVNNTVPGFGFETAEGQIEGFDIDFCKAFAAAVFGTPSPEEGTHYELIPVDADARFNALRAGEFDVLVRNTTWTSSRDGAEGVSFAHPNFYDGQAIIAPDIFGSLEDLDGANICVTAGTTTELNLADYFASRDLAFEPVVLEDYEVIFEAFSAGRCDAVTGDRSALAGLQPLWEEEVPDLTIFEDVISKEPLAPGVVDGDDEWFDVVNMVVNGIILAEELGVSQDSVAQEIDGPSNPFIGALLGVPVQEGEELGLGFDPGIGVDPTFMQNVLQAVGNYADIFERNLAPLGHERGINALWTDGGIQYAIPFR